MAPQVLTGVDHTMRIMTEETFGPAVGVMPVASDDEAIRLMNDSRYGLTAAIWTADADAAIRIGDRVATGTWFMNRCDYLDPALAWTGVKDLGRGCSLSRPSTSVSPGRSRSICARRPEGQPRNRAVHRRRRLGVGATVGPERCRRQASRGTPFGPSTMSNSARLAPLLACGSRSGAGSRRTVTRTARSPRRR